MVAFIKRLLKCCNVLFMFSCSGGMTIAAWKYYIDTGLVTGGNFNSGQVSSLLLSSVVMTVLFSVPVLRFLVMCLFHC